MDFNKKKCLTLLKEKKKLEQEGKFFWDFDKAKHKELTQYLTLLSDDIFYQNCKEYCQIVNLFVTKRITVDEFMEQFGKLRRSNLDALKMREKKLEVEAFGILPETSKIDFQLNPQSRGFTKITSDIYSAIDLFDPDIDFDMNLKHPELLGYGLSEEVLRLDLKENFLTRIKEYCK